MRQFLMFLLLLTSIGFNAQDFTSFSIPVTIDGQALQFPMAGGMTRPQFSAGDLNNDGLDDVIVFDKHGSVVMPFINNGTPNMVDYEFAFQYQENFPELIQWVLFRDFDGDGAVDIFSYSGNIGVAGIQVHKGYFESNALTFEPFVPYLKYPVGNNDTNIYVSSADYPAIDDIDGDGDLDILTFGFGDSHVFYYQNQSIEQGYGRDSLIFILADDCWGRFYESSTSEELTLSDNINDCADLFISSETEDRNLHAGSTLVTMDLDHDGDKELGLGDISFENMSLLTNGGDAETAFITNQDNNYPVYNTPISLDFSMGFYLDMNNDGFKDFVAASNFSVNSGVNYNVAWYYENIEDAENELFSLERTDLLVSDMVDFSSDSYPAFVDYDADGLLDVVVGIRGYPEDLGAQDTRLILLKNIGTATVPEFQLEDDDYLNFSQFNGAAYGLAPTFGDLDGDGDLDLMVGENGGKLFYVENTAGAANPLQFANIIPVYKGIDIGTNSAPFIYDLNSDGVPDLIIGDKQGRLNYFPNQGTIGNPDFVSDEEMAPNNPNFGNVNVAENATSSGRSAPFFTKINGETVAIIGTKHGAIEYYNNIDNNVEGTFDIITEELGGRLYLGENSVPTFADIDDDGLLEMIAGNARGGLSAFQTELLDMSVATEEPSSGSESIKVFPNPNVGTLNIDVSQTDIQLQTLTIYNALGQLVLQENIGEKRAFNIEHLANGIYFCHIRTNKQFFVKKILKVNNH